MCYVSVSMYTENSDGVKYQKGTALQMLSIIRDSFSSLFPVNERCLAGIILI